MLEFSTTECLLDKDGNVTFLNMLNWHDLHYTPLEDSYLSTMFNTVVSVAAALSPEQRLASFNTDTLRMKIFGFRRLVEEVRYHKEQRELGRVQAFEKDNGIFQSGKLYHQLIRDDLDRHEQALFDAFLGVDASNDLLLQRAEIENLMRRIEPNASPAKWKHRIKTMNLEPGDALSFAQFLKWTYEMQHNESKSASESAASGKKLAEGIVKLSVDKGMEKILDSSVWSGSKGWEKAHADGPKAKQDLRNAYIRTYRELRCYKMELNFRELELNCTRL